MCINGWQLIVVTLLMPTGIVIGTAGSCWVFLRKPKE